MSKFFNNVDPITLKVKTGTNLVILKGGCYIFFSEKKIKF